MTTYPFVTHWEVRSPGSPAFVPVSLPHDAMIGERREPDAPSWAHGAYFPGGRYRYRRVWTPPPETVGRELSLRFEGAYRHARVLIDGHEVGGSRSGWREFEVRLDPHATAGEPHTIEVDVDNSATPNARWYTGTGLYRPVWLEVRDSLHIPLGGIGVTTRLQGRSALVRVTVEIVGAGASPVDVLARLTSPAGRVVASSVSTTTTTAIIDLAMEDAQLWSADSPARHTLDVTLAVDGIVRDQARHEVGLREVALDPARGLVVNGRVVLLRGANVHHDSGVLGAATFPAAERRRVRILREAGFNALRCAHNPASRALLEACDEYGMYVVDEAFDGWYDHKTDHDDADGFETLWRDEVASMVAKDRLHPSVILYSVGNENGEAFSPRGRRTATRLVGELRRLDPDRPTTIGVNLVAATFAGLAGQHVKDVSEAGAKSAPDMTSTALNVISNRFGVLAARLPRLAAADRATKALFALVDVAGYNYGTSRYRRDASLHPDRLMVGTETMPGDLARNWRLVQEISQLIGDFVWAGWDYLGEAGGGTWSYGTRRAPFLKPFPQIVSGMGIIDITGEPGAALRLAQAAWGMLDAPAITVRPLDVAPGPYARTAWRSSDAVESWSWRGHEGRRTRVEVYSADDEVELRLNGRSLGRRPAGPRRGFLARFDTAFEPGLLEATGYRNGVARTSSALRTAGPARLRLRAEGPLGRGPADVAFVRVELADDDGIVDTTACDVVTLEVAGPAVLQALGSAAPSTTESFTDAFHATYRGRALAVVRPSAGPGDVVVTATSLAHGEAALRMSSAAAGLAALCTDPFTAGDPWTS